MILVFILLGLIIVLLFLLCIILFSTIRIEIEKLQATNQKVENKLQYTIHISLRFLNKIKWIKVSFDEQNVQKLMKEIPKIDIQKIEQDFRLEDLKALKKLQVKIARFHLESELGVESPIITSFLVAGISSAISILLGKTAKSLEEKSYQYKIVPIYQNKNLYKISFNCIIELKMVHIINVIYILIKKGKSDENERTTSNRKSYGYSYE